MPKIWNLYFVLKLLLLIALVASSDIHGVDKNSSHNSSKEVFRTKETEQTKSLYKKKLENNAIAKNRSLKSLLPRAPTGKEDPFSSSNYFRFSKRDVSQAKADTEEEKKKINPATGLVQLFSSLRLTGGSNSDNSDNSNKNNSSAGSNSTDFSKLADFKKTSNKNKNWDSKDDFLVDSIPYLADKPNPQIQLYSGQIEPGSTDSNIFFVLAKNKLNFQNNDTWLIWINGGPGCSSMYSFFIQNGPLKFNQAGNITYRDETWVKNIDILYIDQPFGTGLSYSDETDKTLSYDIFSDVLFAFIAKFIKIFPEYASKKLYISGHGESGTTISYLAHKILYPKETQSLDVDLKGLFIGNGWMDSKSIYSSYLPVMKQKFDLRTSQENTLRNKTGACMEDLRLNDFPSRTPKCDSIIAEINNINGKSNKNCSSVCNYNIYVPDCDCKGSYSSQIAFMESYMSDTDVQAFFNVMPGKGTTQWKRCSPDIFNQMNFVNKKSVVNLLSDILSKIKVLIYVNSENIAVNDLANQYMISNLTWNGKTGFENYKKENIDYKVDEKVVGSYYSERELTYAVIYNQISNVESLVNSELLVMFLQFAGMKSTYLPLQRSASFNQFGEIVTTSSIASRIAITVSIYVLVVIVVFGAIYYFLSTREKK
ncbi:hypothetical protein BB560_002612 [Smittium megazygosporum]|uniref:Pheromone-processing carboxypeptidase KEX1 n=1 Tax=Smittium megazygosporum TaxID=133381 RepID=A0A2T9ZEC3_9FUNG|nr:hypothetical protein BB560_002612 [Smittium megazygosporum]